MTYKIRHKGKHKRRGLAPGLVAPLVQVALIVVGIIVGVVLPRPAEGKTDWVSVTGLILAAVGVILAGVGWLIAALAGRRAKQGRVADVVTLMYRASFVLVIAGLAIGFFRIAFR